MANTVHQPDLLSESTTKEEEPHVSEPLPQGNIDQQPSVNEDTDKQSETETPSATSLSSVAVKDPILSTSTTPVSSAETRPATGPTRPALVQLGSSSSQPSSSTNLHPPKKFNAVNIKKKFLEKNSAAAMATATSASPTSKSSSSICEHSFPLSIVLFQLPVLF